MLVDSASDKNPSPIENNTLITQALAGQYAKQTTEIDGVSTMSLAMPVMIEEQLIGVIYLSHPLHDINTVLSDLRMLWISSTAIALILSSIVGLVLSRAITRPLHNLTDGSWSCRARTLRPTRPGALAG